MTRMRPGRDPDPDGVALLVSVVLGVGAALAASIVTVAWWPWVAAAGAVGLAALLTVGHPGSRPILGPATPSLRGVVPAARLVTPGWFALVALALAALAVTGIRLALVRAAVLPDFSGEVVTVHGAVTAEPDPTRYGGRLVCLTVTWVGYEGHAWTTRERATLFLPARAGPVALGDRLALTATVRPADSTDPLAWRAAVELGRPTVIARSPSRSLPVVLSGELRERARDQALAILPSERAGLLAGMALGDTSMLRGDVKAAFTAAGMTHLVAVSGSNLALLLGAVLGVALLLGAGRPTLGAVGIGLVLAFVFLTRWEPSVLRAGVMAVLALVGVTTGRGPGGRRALCLAVAILLLADPALAFSLGFLLSVTATAGILWLSPPLARILPERVPEVARVAIAATLAAQAVAVPVAALATGTLPLAGLPANLLALPLAAAPMLLGVLNAALAIPAPWAATLACVASDPFLAALIAIARRAEGLGAIIALPTGPARLLPLAIPAVLTLAPAARRGHRRPGAQMSAAAGQTDR